MTLWGMSFVSLTVAGALVAVALGASSVPAGSRAACGKERWTVKTLKDKPALLSAKATTLAYLVSRPAPRPIPDTRLPFERRIFTVTARVTLVKSEDDSDLHLILSDGSRTMIAESPATACTVGATVARRAQMTQARALVRVCANARVSGVAFFDFRHGQTGVAPNAIELHPVLSFRCLDGSSTPTPTPTPSNGNCAASYPTVCIPPPPPDLNCGDISYRRFTVLWNVPAPDPHHFDSNKDGVGCES